MIETLLLLEVCFYGMKMNSYWLQSDQLTKKQELGEITKEQFRKETDCQKIRSRAWLLPTPLDFIVGGYMTARYEIERRKSLD
tara:strand:- start:84 stop:332 length:249 start_codon:yes stop_codon:yes gene_type:complete